ncbi:hypothetical protein D3C84_698590 [compost metagenome]
MRRRCQFLTVHKEATVTGERHHGTLRIGQLSRHRCRYAIAHGTVGRPKQRTEGTVLITTVHPPCVVTGAAGQNTVSWQRFVQPGDHLTHLYITRRRGSLEVATVATVQVGGPILKRL